MGIRRVFLLLVLVAGCRQPAEPPWRQGGRVDLDGLARLHPAWAEVRALDAKIARLKAVAPSVASIPPPGAAKLRDELQPDDTQAREAAAAVERREIERLTRERVASDYEVLVARLDPEVDQYEAIERANALARADAESAKKAEELRLRYKELADSYGQRIGPLLLRRLALEPNVTDAAFYPLQERQQRAAEYARLGREIEALRAERDAELRALVEIYERETANLRAEAEAAARTAASRYRAERLAQLRQSRDRQQRRLMQDMERALASAMGPSPSEGAATTSASRLAAAARERIGVRVAQANTAGGRVAAETARARARALAELQAQRERLATLVRAATKSLATTVAAEERLRVEFDGAAADPQLTRRLAVMLERRWNGSLPRTSWLSR